VPHDAEAADLTVSVEGEFDRVTAAEVRLIDAYLGDLIPAMLLTRAEEE
jgi:hypothetical protein